MKKELEIALESLEGFRNPKIQLEQYVTPANLAGFILTNAKLFGDLKTVVDLGCGTGILVIGSAMLGAYSIGIEIDPEALKIAKANAKKLGVSVDLIACDVRDLKLKKNVTVIMNPPFGIQRKNADRVFLEKAFEIAEVIYSIHSAESEIFVRKRAEESGFRITHLWKFMIPLRRTYSFHEKAFKFIPVEVFRIEKNDRPSGR
ncbi:MAG: METTL5 family protein [Archaeoglobaceae archaeon]|nr:METTL5 family protein [Archaeoglobaceae archaeon]MDW8118106.1 METTL5 family protein [Archaeoglobaceae archaeon]